MAIGLAAVAATSAGATAVHTIGTIAVRKIKDAVARGGNLSSLADLTKPARVEPIVMFDESLERRPALTSSGVLTDVLQATLSTFAGYYLQGVSLLMNVGRVETLKVLDALNPERSAASVGAIRDAVFSTEAYAQGLPSLEEFTLRETKAANQTLLFTYALEDASGIDPNTEVSVGSTEKAITRVYEKDSLAVGKLVTVEIKDGNNTAKLPVLIRLVPASLKPTLITQILASTVADNNQSIRWTMVKAGQLRFVRDFIFQTDLIDQHRRLLINDTSNVYMTINDRRRNNSIKAMTSGVASFADASNIAIISRETEVALSKIIRGRLDSLSVRKRLFDASYLILLVIIDEQWKRVTIYHRGFDLPTQLSFDQIKSSEKGKGPDITEILSAYRLGATPTL